MTGLGLQRILRVLRIEIPTCRFGLDIGGVTIVVGPDLSTFCVDFIAAASAALPTHESFYASNGGFLDSADALRQRLSY
jgi:hypothetical protein